MRPLLLLPLTLTGCTGLPIPAGAGVLAIGAAFVALLVADVVRQFARRM